MKTILSIIFVTCSLAICSAQTKTYNTTDMEKEILSLSEKIWKAMQSEDFETMTTNIAPEAVFVHMGATFTRDEEIDVLRRKGIVLKALEMQEKSVRIVGTTAVVLSKIRLTAVVGGNEVTNPFVVTETYSQWNGRWLLVSFAYTRIVY